MNEQLTKEEMERMAARLTEEGMRGCYDGEGSRIFFAASDAIERAVGFLRKQTHSEKP